MCQLLQGAWRTRGTIVLHSGKGLRMLVVPNFMAGQEMRLRVRGRKRGMVQMKGKAIPNLMPGKQRGMKMGQMIETTINSASSKSFSLPSRMQDSDPQ